MAKVFDGIEREHVLRAVAEYDKLGRRAFLEKYGFGSVRQYPLKIGQTEYDSKAILGVARKYAHPSLGPLAHDDFSGGRSTVVKKLRSLGFEMPSAPRNDAWNREELILALVSISNSKG